MNVVSLKSSMRYGKWFMQTFTFKSSLIYKQFKQNKVAMLEKYFLDFEPTVLAS